MNKIYQNWLQSKELLRNEKQELLHINPKDIEQYFTNQPMSFGTAGVRGIMGLGTNRMNRLTYFNLALAYGKYLLKITKHRPIKVAVGHDNRQFSDFFTICVANALSSLGIIVYLFKNNQLMPTPIISFTIRDLKLDGGIIVTASHNPKEYNGFKAYKYTGGQVLTCDSDLIQKEFVRPEDIHKIKIVANKKLIKTIPDSIINKYFIAAKNLLNNKNWKFPKSIPIVFTGHHGTSCKLIPLFLKQVGVKVYPVKQQCFFNKDFINSTCPNPEDFASFDLAIKLADKVKSKLCIGVDPDADRMAIIVKHNGQWRMMTGNEMGIIYTYYLLSKYKQNKQPFLVSTHVSTNLVDKIAKDYKAIVYRTGTGFKWIGDIVEKQSSNKHFIVGFEEAIGALTYPINRDKDSFTASLLALEIYSELIKQNNDFVDLLNNEIYAKYGHWFGITDSFVIKSTNWMLELKKYFNDILKYKSNSFAGIKIAKKSWNEDGNCQEWWFDKQSWLKFRISGTEPKFKIYYNLYGDSQEALIKTYNLLHKSFKKMLGL